MRRDTWIDDEPRFLDVLIHVFRRAWRRAPLTLAAALLVSGAVLGWRLHKKPGYVGTALLRIAEGVTTDATPRAPRSLRAYIANIALSRTRLAEILRRYEGEAPTQQEIELFREDIEVAIAGNYFHEYVYATTETGTRSATISIEYGAGDPELAAGVVHDLAGAVVEATESARELRTASAREQLAEAVRLARARMIELEAGADVLTRAAFAQRLAALERQAAETELAASVERAGIGLNFELVDEEVTEIARRLTPGRAALLFAAVFALMLPLCAVAIGAFDRRVYARDDLLHLGVPVLGVLPKERV